MKKVLLALAVFAMLAVGAWAGSSSGTINSDSDWDIIDFYTDSADIDVTFTWPQGADFMVTVFGMDHNYLNEFHLLDGETINLTGGGQFYLAVHALRDKGSWTASW
jgi:hypothetical protein